MGCDGTLQKGFSVTGRAPRSINRIKISGTRILPLECARNLDKFNNKRFR
jgi:hypothetical protein